MFIIDNRGNFKKKLIIWKIRKIRKWADNIKIKYERIITKIIFFKANP